MIPGDVTGFDFRRIPSLGNGFLDMFANAGVPVNSKFLTESNVDDGFLLSSWCSCVFT